MKVQTRMGGVGNGSCAWRFFPPIHRVGPLTLSSQPSLLIDCCLIFTCIQRTIHGFRCCSAAPHHKTKQTQTPQLLKIAVTGVTEILRLFTPAAPPRGDLVDGEWEDKVSVSNADDVLSIIRSDYEKAYFVTGFFTSAIYAEECIFEDPTIKFQGKELYARNLGLLLPFFESPSIQLKELDKGLDSGTVYIVASWKLSLKLQESENQS